jgi:hypothetical protein
MDWFDRGGTGGGSVSDFDPLFYRGHTPVLGAPVELRQSGELPGQFPSAGPAAPTPPTAPAPGAPPTPPNFSFGFSGLQFPEMADIGPPPEFPGGGAPTGLFGPGAQRPSWLSGGLEVLDRVGAGAEKLWKAGQYSAEAAPNWLETPSNFSLTGPEGAPTLTPDQFSLTGDEGAPTLTPDQFSLTGGPGAAASGPGLGTILPGLGLAGGLYGAINAPTPTGKALSSAGAASSGASLAAQLAPQALGALGPAAGVIGAPAAFVEAMLLAHQFLGPDRAHFPEGYTFIPGSSESGGAGAMAVDPMTGAILEYHGNGRYGWADQTQQGQRATPQQLQQWGVFPGGELAQQPGYGADFIRQLTRALGPAATASNAIGRPDLRANPDVRAQETPGVASMITSGATRDVPSSLQGDVMRAGDELIPADVWSTLTDPWGMLARGEGLPGALWAPVGGGRD